jgi:hypothetical protein
MAITLADIDARLAATAPQLHADRDLEREVAELRCDWLLDMRLLLTRPAVAPPATTERDPLVEHGTD